MPNITWQELSDIKHILSETQNKLSKDSKYLGGVIEMINSLVEEHEDEKS